MTSTKLTVSATNCFDTPCTGNLSILDMVYDGNDATGNTVVLWLRPTTGVEGGVYRTVNALTTATFTNQLLQTATANSRGELASVTIGGVTTMYAGQRREQHRQAQTISRRRRNLSAILAGRQRLLRRAVLLRYLARYRSGERQYRLRWWRRGHEYHAPDD